MRINIPPDWSIEMVCRKDKSQLVWIGVEGEHLRFYCPVCGWKVKIGSKFPDFATVVCEADGGELQPVGVQDREEILRCPKCGREIGRKVFYKVGKDYEDGRIPGTLAY